MLMVVYITMFICGALFVAVQGKPKHNFEVYSNMAFFAASVFGFVGIIYSLVT